MTDVPAYVDAMAAAIGLELRPEHREEVIQATAVLLAQAELLMGFPLEETVEALPVITA